MKKILLVLSIALSLLFVSFASAEDQKMPIPPTSECMTLFKASGFLQENELWTTEKKKMINKGCLTVDPYDLTKKETENWDNPVCEEVVPAANNMTAGIDIDALGEAYSKAFSKAYREAYTKYGDRIDNSGNRLDTLWAKIADLEKKKVLNKQQAANLVRLKAKLRIAKKQNWNNYRALEKNVAANPVLREAEKDYNQARSKVGYATLATFVNGCLLSPDLNQLGTSLYGMNNKLALYILQEVFEQTPSSSEKDYRYMSLINTTYKALKAAQVDTGQFKFSAKQAARAISQSEGRDFAHVGGVDKVRSTQNKLFVRTQNEGHKVCISVSYKENDKIKYLTGIMTTKGLFIQSSLSCKD